MPAPIALGPLAWKAAQLGAVAALSYYAARRRGGNTVAEPRDIWRETVLNDVEEGLELDTSRTEGQTHHAVAGKFKRGIRLGANGPGIEVEIASLSRLRFRKI